MKKSGDTFIKLCKTIGNYVVLKYLVIVICMVGLHAVSAQRAVASPVLFGSNYYEFVQVIDPFTGTNNTWNTASASASASVYNGLCGHLATITTQGENDFLLSLVSGSFDEFAGAWLGGDSGGWLVGPESGQNFSYENWGGSEPNNSGYAYMNIGTSHAGIASGEWADDSGDQGVPDANDPVIGYFVEYEAVPIPGAVWLLGSGLFGLVAIRRRKKS